MERYREKQGDLFRGINTRDLLDSLKLEVSKKIQNLEDDILNISENQYINNLIEEYKMECPIMQFDQYTIKPRRVLVSSEILPINFKFAAPEEVERNVFKLNIPFVGDKEVLQYWPANIISTLGGSSRFIIGYKEVYVDILDYPGNGENIKNECDRYIDGLKKMMGYLKNEIDNINRTMPQYIRQTFIVRKERIKKEYDSIANLGLPIVTDNATPKTYSVSTVERRYEEPIVSNLHKFKSLTPTMAEDVYQDILSAINTIGQNIERYPKTIENQNEEIIREHFLTQLSTSFKGCSSTGESFNHEGKTDVMVKHGNDILFIAECKIWKGAKKLHEAIDQLLSYLTWRDSKTALLIFNKDTNMQTIVDSIQESIPSHSNFVKFVAQRDSGWYDYIFRLTDSTTEIKMAVMVFNFKE